LIDAQAAERRPRRILGDTAYGNGKVRAEMQSREIKVLAPIPTAPPTGRFAKAEFEVDLEAETITCPAGRVVPLSPPDRKGQRTTHFRISDCRPCPLRAQCTSRDRRNVTISAHEDLLQAARLALEDEATREHLRRTRPRVERLLGLLAHRYGARKSRYSGRRKAEMQAAWAAALVNLNPIATALAAEGA
jgi:hypothetical protein